MSAEGATATPTAIPGRLGDDDARQNDPYRFLSTRLVRELIAADSVAEAAGEEAEAIASRLIEAVADGLSQPGVALLNTATLGVVAVRGLEAEEQSLLQVPPPGGGTPVARRALEERRVFLLGQGSREPLLPALREVRADRTGLVVVPLCDREQCAGVLILASAETTLPAAFLRSLAPAFRLLTLLLHPGRWTDPSSGDAPVGDAERLTVDIEELRSQLAEARDQCRSLEDQDSSSQAAQRAAGEGLRARVSELEATLAAGGTERGMLDEVESELGRRDRELEERVKRVAELEGENQDLAEQLARAERTCRDAESRALASSSAEEALRDAMSQPGLGDAEPAAALPLLDEGDVELGEIAEAAAAAIGDTEGPCEVGPEALVDTSDDAVSVEVPPDDGPALGIWHLDTDPTSRAWASELAERSGAVFWTGEGEPPHAAKSMLVINLFDESVGRTADLAENDIDSLVYATDGETGQGFEIGRVGWVRRPLDPAVALERIQSRVPRRLGGIVIVSAQLRELAGLRQALADVDAAGSVACDSRQATDLLEIVRRPDAVLIDLSLEGGQGLAVARQLRTTPETSDVPLLFLLPETLQAETLRADAERGGVLGPYGSEDARRLLNGALAHPS